MPSRVNKPSVRSTDAAFRKQVVATRDALKTFKVVAGLKSPGLAQTALEELISITVRFRCASAHPFFCTGTDSTTPVKLAFSDFLPAYVTVDSFLELCPAVLATVNAFVATHPDIKCPVTHSELVSLVEHAKRAIEERRKQGTFLLTYSCLNPLIYSFSIVRCYNCSSQPI